MSQGCERETMKILILNGPNLNMLGKREPEIYGKRTLEELNHEIAQYALTLNEKRADASRQIELDFFQSNHEGILVDTIQDAPLRYKGIIYNPAAHTHYSIALRDAIASIRVPVVEVHLSNINTREAFRSMSVIQDVCIGQCMGKNVDSYKDALDMLVTYLEADNLTNSVDLEKPSD